MLAAGGIWFNYQQKVRDRWSAKQRAEDNALRSYLDQMDQLQLEVGSEVPEKNEDEKKARALARARTLTTLERLDDANRKGHALRYLYGSKLIGHFYPQYVAESPDQGYNTDKINALAQSRELPTPPLISLDGANLGGANLAGLTLTGANLTFANLRGANLSSHADLSGAVVEMADMTGANMQNINLRYSIMRGANLEDADLRGAYLYCTELDGAKLSGATMPDGSTHP